MFGSIFNKKEDPSAQSQQPAGTAPVPAQNAPADPNAANAQAPVSPAQQDQIQTQPGQAQTDGQGVSATPAATNPDGTPVDPNGATATPGADGTTPTDPNAAPNPTDPNAPQVNADGATANGVQDQPNAEGGNPALRADSSALSHLDPRATQVLTHAQEEAKRIHQQNIEPDQLLIGLLYDEQLYKFLGESGVDGGKLSKDVQAHEKMGTYKGQPTLSQTSQAIFEQAYRDAKMRGSNFVSPEDVLVVLFGPNYSTAAYLKQYGLQKETTIEKLAKNPNSNYGKKSTLEKFGIDLTEEARQGKLDPVAGREKEIDRMVHILVRRTKNNPIIIGETGVGKTAIVEGLAQLIVAGNVPKDLKEKRIFQLDVASLIAGASHRGEFEERLRGVINEVLGSNNRIVLFIDEVHVLMGAGEGEGMNAANLIKPHLARGHLQIIGATTTTEYRKNFEKDKAFERRFQPVTAEEPSEENAFEMLKVIRPKYEKYHKITLPDEALKECIKLAKKYIGERYLPDKAIDLLDEACSEVKLQQDKGGRTDNGVKKTDIEKVVSAWTGIPITKLTEDESEKLLKLEDRIHERLVDQEPAVIAVSEAVRRGRIGLAAANRPIASFVFLGPTGVGKTELAKCLAELLFGRDDAMARLDMSEYMEKHEVAKLIGAPPGYVGYEEGGQLTEAVRKKPYSIVLFDEIEKAHPDVFNMLLQLLEDGRLTDNRGNTISFKNTIVICTSNIGSAIIQKQLNMVDTKAKRTPEEFNKIFKDLQAAVKEELIKFFRPELLNRFDEVVVFKPLQPEHMAGIARRGIAKTAGLLKEQGYMLQITEKAIAKLAKDGYDPVYGARPLRRLIQTAIENPIAIAIIGKKFAPGDTIVIDYNDDVNEFIFYKGNGALVQPLTDEQFKTVLLKIVHPENITSEAQKKMFIDLHTKVDEAAKAGNKLAVAIMKVTDSSSDVEIQKIRKELEDGKAKGDAFAKAVMEVIDAVAQQIQASQNLKKVLLDIIDPAKITGAKKREIFMQLHDKVVAESQANNPLALRILAVKPETTSDVIEQLMADLTTAKAQDNEFAIAILSVVNTELTEEAERARASAPETRFKQVLKELINPLYLAPADSKAEFSAVHDKLLKARDQNHPLAAAILAVTDITSDADILNIKKELEQGKADGDELAGEILELINKELAREPLRQLKKALLLINNPLTAESSQEREDYTVLRNKLTEAGEKGNTLAAELLKVTEATSYEEIQKFKDQLKAAKDQNDEMAILVLDAAGIALSEALAASDVKPKELTVQQVKVALLSMLNPLTADTPEKKESYTALHDKVSEAGKSGNELAKKLLTLTTEVKDEEVKSLKVELEKAKEAKDEIATLVLDAARKEPAPKEDAEVKMSEELVFAHFKKTIVQIVDPTKAETPEKVEKYTDLRTKVSQAAQANDELAKKLLNVTDASTDEELKALKAELEQAKVEKKEVATLVLDTADIEVKETLELAKAADAVPAEEKDLNEAEKDEATSNVVVAEEKPADQSEQAPSADAGATGDAQSGQTNEVANQPVQNPTYEVQNSEPFSAAQLSSEPTPALGMETPAAPMAPPSTGAAAEVPAYGSVAPVMPSGQAGGAAGGVFQPAEVPAAPLATPPTNGGPVDNMGSSNSAGAAMQPPVSAYNYNLSQPVEREIE